MLVEDFEQQTRVDIRLGLVSGTPSASATHAFSSLSRPSTFFKVLKTFFKVLRKNLQTELNKISFWTTKAAETNKKTSNKSIWPEATKIKQINLRHDKTLLQNQCENQTKYLIAESMLSKRDFSKKSILGKSIKINYFFDYRYWL